VKAIVIASPGMKAELREVPIPVPGTGEIVVAMRGCGICGTDRHIVEEGLPTAIYPIIPGHEPWGEVTQIGPEVQNVKLGDLIAVDPSLHCGICVECRQARGNLCKNWGSIGGTKPGAWAEYFLAPARNAYLLDQGFPLEVASLIEPVACAVRGLVRLNPKQGKSLLIVGGGTMGLILGILLDINGCQPIIIVETNQKRREIAAKLTGLQIISPEDSHGITADFVIDATGVPEAIEAALKQVNPGGTFMIFGVASPHVRVSMSPYDIYKNEILITSSMAILHSFGPAIELMRKHASRFKPLLTHQFELNQFENAISVLSSGEAVKVALVP
jgi:2-desacetyl-2-hydroxyethyl bacteriochlorophyllide A dehydrogenase